MFVRIWYQYIVSTFVTMLVCVIPMQRFAKTGRPVEARHSRAHSHSSTFLKYWKTGVPIGIGGCAIGNPEDAPKLSTSELPPSLQFWGRQSWGKLLSWGLHLRTSSMMKSTLFLIRISAFCRISLWTSALSFSYTKNHLSIRSPSYFVYFINWVKSIKKTKFGRSWMIL